METKDQREWGGRGPGRPANVTSHAVLLGLGVKEWGVVDDWSKGSFQYARRPIVEKEGEQSESYPGSDRDVDHETQQG